MKNIKEVIDSATDASTRSAKNWMDTAEKARQNMMSPNAFEKNSELYREWLNNQMNILRPGNQAQSEETKNHEKESAPHQDAFSAWYTMQMENARKMMDFNREVFNNWMNSTSHHQPAGTWPGTSYNSITDNWKNMMNSAFDNMSSMMSKGVAKDAFSNMFFTGNMMNSLRDFYKPVLEAMQKGSFDFNSWQKLYSQQDQYKTMVETMFSNFFPQTGVKEMFERYVHTMQQQFASAQDSQTQSWNALKSAMASFPEFMNADSGKFLHFYNQWNENYSRVIAPLMKLLTPGKEKEQMEHMMNVLDKFAILSIKQSQLQYLVYKAGGNAVSESMKVVAAQFNENQQSVEFQKFFNEWTAANEKIFTTLFASEEYSGLKAEILSLSMTIRHDMEKQFEQNFSGMPVIFRSEADELHKTIHDLKKKVRDLEARLSEFTPEVKASNASSKTKKSAR